MHIINPVVGDLYCRDWGYSGLSIFEVIEVLDPMQRRCMGFLLYAVVLSDDGPRALRLVINSTIKMHYRDFNKSHNITLITRRLKEFQQRM